MHMVSVASQRRDRRGSGGRASMLGIFLEDLVGDFAPLWELLLLVRLEELGKELALLLCEGLRHAGECKPVGVSMLLGL